MSRCKLIIAGTSGFSMLASWIGNTTTKYYTQIIDDSGLKASFECALQAEGLLNTNFIDPLIKSFSIACYIDYFSDKLALEEKINLMETCIELDKENCFYKLSLACMYYEGGNIELADKLLLQEINKKQVKGIEWLASTVHSNNTTTLMLYLNHIEYGIKNGSVIASIVKLLHEHFYLKSINFDYYENLLKNTSGEVLGVELLQQKLNEFAKK